MITSRRQYYRQILHMMPHKLPLVPTKIRTPQTDHSLSLSEVRRGNEFSLSTLRPFKSSPHLVRQSGVPCFSSKSVKLSANAEEDEKEEKGLSEDGENKLCLARPQISEEKEKKKTHLRFLSTLMNNLILRGENVPRVPTFKRFSDIPPNNIQIVKGWSLPEIFSKPM